MATRALTPVARPRSRATTPARVAPGPERDLRQVLLSQDAESIWQELALLVRGSKLIDPARYEQVTQELFLHLLATDRIGSYIEEDYSDSDIRVDLLSMLSG